MDAAQTLSASGVAYRPNYAAAIDMLRRDIVRQGKFTAEQAQLLSDRQVVDAYCGRPVDTPVVTRSRPIMIRDGGVVLDVR